MVTLQTYVPPPTERLAAACTRHNRHKIAAVRKYGSQFASVFP